MSRVFRTALLGGFKKKDVITYLESLIEENRGEAREWENRLTEAEALNRQLSENLNAASRSLDELRTGHDDQSALVDQQQRENLRLTGANTRLLEENARLLEENARLLEEHRRLLQQSADLEDRILSLEKVQQEYLQLKNTLLLLEQEAQENPPLSLDALKRRLSEISSELSALAEEAGRTEIHAPGLGHSAPAAEPGATLSDGDAERAQEEAQPSSEVGSKTPPEADSPSAPSEPGPMAGDRQPSPAVRDILARIRGPGNAASFGGGKRGE